MRTLVDIPEADLQALDKLSERRKASRAKIIREAVSDYLEKHDPKQADEAFGMWKGRGIDALDYQRRVRDEW